MATKGSKPHGILNSIDELIREFGAGVALILSGIDGTAELFKRGLHNWWYTFVVGGLHAATPAVADGAAAIQPVVDALVSAIKQFGPALQASVGAPISQLAEATILTAEKAMTDRGVSTVNNAVADAALAFALAFEKGVGSATVAAAFESVFPRELNVLDGLAPMLAEMAGFKEVTGSFLEPLYKNAFGRSLEYHYRSIFRPELPDEADAVTWHARRLLTDDQLRTVFGFSGLKPEYETPYIAGAYRAVNPRSLATIYQDINYNPKEIEGMLQFYGLRDQDVAIMLKAFALTSVKNVRNQYLSAVLNAAERGTLTQAEVDSALTDLEFSATAQHWVNLTIATRKLEQLAEIYRKSISEAYKYQQITDNQYVPALEAVGIAQADAEAHFAVDSIALRGHEAAAAARAAAKLAAQTTRAESQAAIANFLSGNIDAIALAAALLVAGIPAQIVPFAVDIQTLKLAARQHYVFGVKLGPDKAIRLREEVAALKEQVIKKVLTVEQARPQLVALGLPESNIEALLAEWDAQANKVVLPI